MCRRVLREWSPESIVTPVDLGLVAAALLMVFTPMTVLFFHTVFVLLTLGAFFWRFRAFVVRTIIWVGLTTAVVLEAIRVGATQPEEAIEIPLLTSILVLVFMIARHRARAQLLVEYHAFHDSLTDLPNRRYFRDRLTHALAGEGRAPVIAVLFIDLDDFKVVNDSLGHDVGDRLLAAVAERLRACVGVGDTLARLGGDEFTVLLTRGAVQEDALHVAERIRAAFRTPFVLGSHEVSITPSIGIALSEPAHENPDDMLRFADLAMYRAKENGKGRVEVFEASIGTDFVRRLATEDSERRVRIAARAA